MLGKLVGLFNQRDGVYTINVVEGVVTLRDGRGKEVDPIVAKCLAELIVDQYDECYVYVGQRNHMLKIGMSSNLDRRDRELNIERIAHIRCRGRSEARDLEKAILEFLTSMGILLDSEEWFKFRKHDVDYVCAILATCDPQTAIRNFRLAKANYVHIKQRCNNGEISRSKILEYIYMCPITALRTHACIEFGFLPAE